MAVSWMADWGRAGRGDGPTQSALPRPAVKPRAAAAPRPVVRSAPAAAVTRPLASTGNWFTRLFSAAPAAPAAPRKSAAELEAEGKAAKDRADAMRNRVSLDGGGAAGKLAIAGTPSTMIATDSGRDRRLQEAAEKESAVRRQARASEPGEKKRMGWSEYEKLGATEKAAVDFNGLLDQAIKKDSELLGLDTDNSGSVSMKEVAGKARDEAGYRTAYQRIYGTAPTADTDYAPNTLGLLNSMELRDAGDIGEYLRGAGFVTEADMARGATKGAVAGPSLDQEFLGRQARDQLAANVAAGMAQLQQTLEAGRAKVAGGNVKVGLGAESTTDDQRAAFIDSIRTSLLRDDAPTTFALEGEGPRFDLEGGISLNPLIEPGTQERYGAMSQEFERQIGLGATIQELMDKRQLTAAGFGESGFDLSEWVDYVATRDKDAKKGGTTVEQDLMAQLAPGAGDR